MDSVNDTVPPLPDVWNETLGELSVLLNGLSGTTEEEFLSIGGKLHDFYQRVGQLAGISREISLLINGEEINSAMNGLRSILERMSHHFSGEDNNEAASFRTLEEIKRSLAAINKPLTSFTTIHNTLKSLSLSIKIESARLREAGAGFSLLATDVSNLSVQVHEKVSEIFEHKADLTASISRTLDLVKEISSGQMQDIRIIMGSARQSLEELNGINNRCADAVNSVESSAVEISRNIGEVVTSMQFHDIVRQQVEHVCDALNELRSRLMAHVNGREPLCGDECAETFHVCTLQVAQLRHAGEGFSRAVAQILENLEEVERRQARIADMSRSAAGSGSGDCSFFRTLEEGLSSVISVLTNSAAKNRELSDVVSMLAGTVAGISGFVNEITNIGEDIKLVALNARIKSSRAGSEGAAIGALAEAVKELSLEAMHQSGAISGLLLTVIDGANELCTGTDRRIAGMESEIEDISGEISMMLDTIRRINNDQIRSLERMDDVVVTLTTDISNTTGGVTVHTMFASVIGDVIARIETIIAAALNQCSDTPRSPDADSSWWLSERYTMQSERAVHASITGTGEEVSEQRITQDDSDPGDNIEFF